MIGFFSKIRRRLMLDSQIRRYFFYSLGEIILIVVGILIANLFASKADLRKERSEEIRILKGIKESLVQDTTTLRTNIKKYQVMSSNDSLIYYHLLYQKPLDEAIVNSVHYASTYNSFLVLRQSYAGDSDSGKLDIISNFVLRDNIKNIYEDQYATLLRIENEDVAYDYEGIMNPKFQEYIGVRANERNGSEIFILDYDKLLNDKQFHQEMFKYWQIKNSVRLRRYLPLRIKVIRLINQIDKELLKLSSD